MTGQAPTVLVYGTPTHQDFFDKVIAPDTWGMVIDNGSARDAVFTVYENLARADAIVAFPNAHPVHLLTLLAEAEVGHPLIVQGEPRGDRNFPRKPIVFYGSESDWAPFKEQLQGMLDQGLMRPGFDRLAQYITSPDEAREYILRQLPEQVPSTRLHYYVHTKKSSDLSVEIAGDTRPPADITISCFGSASTKSDDHLKRADRAAKMFARNNWNILHGGGDAGVMGQLSESGQKAKAHVSGITVDASGAPVISFERDTEAGRPENIDHFVASKDMLHRIETYAGHSEAFVSLDGGVGSLQEVYVIAELLSQNHPAVTYETVDGTRAPKPLMLLNESGIYSPIVSYLQDRGLNHILDRLQVVNSIDELERGLQQHFERHRPVARELREKAQFRDLYAEVDHPMSNVRKGPDLGTLLTDSELIPDDRLDRGEDLRP